MRQLPTGIITLLFTDIEGSTHLLQKLGERYASVLAECRHLLRTAFQQWNGYEVDIQGDAFFVVFERATDAISSAALAQQMLAEHTWPEGISLRVRMGLHTGEPALTSEGYVGIDVHHAARIMSVAHGGQVLLSQVTRDLIVRQLPAGVNLQDMGEHRLRDMPHSGHLFQLLINDLPAVFPPIKTLTSRLNNLPLQPTTFVGRQTERVALEHLLRRAEVRLVTLTGVGGTGKTRLALQVAAEISDLFADGIFFVDLAAVSEPAFVLSSIAKALRIKEEGDQSLEEALKEELQQKRLLLLLDNFEQVIPAANQVSELLSDCPQIKILVTSRIVLHIQAEHEFIVPPLALPDSSQLSSLKERSQSEAVTLFLQRAQSINPSFSLTEANASVIVEITMCLDGLPLAIELAAARMKFLSPEELFTRLGQRFKVLTGGSRDVATRQQTLRNTIEWSYNLLESEEQKLFQRLSVFVGGFTLEGVEAIYTTLDGDATIALDVVSSLLDKSLLQRRVQNPEEASRFSMLETIREYGLEMLATSGEQEQVHHAHAVYMCAFVQQSSERLSSPEQLLWLERLEREYDNVRAAMQWLLENKTDRGAMALSIGTSLRDFWYIHGYLREGTEYLEQALTQSEGGDDPVRLKALYAAARLHETQGEHDRAEVLLTECLALYKAKGDTANIAYALHLQADIAWGRGNFVLAHTQAEESLAIFKQLDDQGAIATLLLHLGGVATDQGDYTRARQLLEESLAIGREQKEMDGIAEALFNLARIDFLSLGDRGLIHARLEESLASYREANDQESIAYCLWLAGLLALEQGDLSLAHTHIGQAKEYLEEIKQHHGTTLTLSALARVYAAQGDSTVARVLYEKSLVLARKTSNGLHIASALEGLASLMTTQEQAAQAARLWGAAQRTREAAGTPLPPVEQASYKQAVEAARAQLGAAVFNQEWARGRNDKPGDIVQEK